MLYETRIIIEELKQVHNDIMTKAIDYDDNGFNDLAMSCVEQSQGIEKAIKIIEKLEDAELQNQFKDYLQNERGCKMA